MVRLGWWRGVRCRLVLGLRLRTPCCCFDRAVTVVLLSGGLVFARCVFVVLVLRMEVLRYAPEY